MRTIGALAQADLAWLIEHFGRTYGAWLHDAAHGRDDRDVVTESEPKSISRETTFERDLSARRDRAELSAIFTDLCVRLAADLKRKGYAGRTIGVKLRYDNFATVTRDRTIDAPTQDAQAIRRAAGECLKRVPLERRIRLLGVRMGALSPVTAEMGVAPAAPSAPAPRLTAARRARAAPAYSTPPAANAALPAGEARSASAAFAAAGAAAPVITTAS